jgi:hypothetical protein
MAMVIVFSLFIGLVVNGTPRTEQILDLNNSGVWVTSNSKIVYGRMNRSAGAIDVVLSDSSQLRSSRLDVFQDQESVLGWQRDRGRYFPIDTGSGRMVEGTDLLVDPASRIDMGGGVLALITPDGEVRVVTYVKNQIPDPSQLLSERAMMVTLKATSAGVAIAVDSVGTVFAATTTGDWVLIPKGKAPQTGSVTGTGEVLSTVEVTLINGIGVVADSRSGEVYTTEGGRHHLGLDAGVVLQQPTATGDRVVVGLTTGLRSLSLRDDGSWGAIYTLSDPGPGRLPTAPVVLGGYIYGAWSGSPVLVIRLSEDGTYISDDGTSDIDRPDRELVDPVFRVNYGSVVLNDLQTGWVYDVTDQVASDELESSLENTSPEPQDTPASRNDPVTAFDDQFWVRPGQTSILHVLDNDLNPGSGLLAISAVSQPSVGELSIAPNGQTLLFTAPVGWANDISFNYTASSRSLIEGETETDQTSSAVVTVSMQSPDQNSPPRLREAIANKPYTVVSGGTISLNPLGDWRDDDSDALVIVEAMDLAGRLIPVTNQSVIRYTAFSGLFAQDVTIRYVVMDSHGATAVGELVVEVLGSSATTRVPPIAHSDVVRGVVGQPLAISPLENDQVGADPTVRDPKLRLAAPVDGRIGLVVETDLASGVLTVTASRAGPYFLNYSVAYGSMFDTGDIRVDIVERDSILAMPDAMVLHGTVGGYVDVLANDHDPSGSVLTVVSLAPQEPDLLRVAIVDGRWVWIQARAATPTVESCLVHYVVTDGSGNEATGQITVTFRPRTDNDHVRLVEDHAVVRAGDVALIPVLDNDVAASGGRLELYANTANPNLPPGQLKVSNPAVPSTQAWEYGQAFVDGDYVRFVAPASVDWVEWIRVEYLAGVPGGTPATGVLWVAVMPAPSDRYVNLPPNPANLEVRCVLGSTAEIFVSPYGQDPDGDSVTVVGLAVPPKYGRITEIRGNTLIYESYPDAKSPGTDSFQFIVKDRWGATAIGGVRIGVVRPGQVPEPVAIDDFYTARPGSVIYIRPLVNDIIPVGTGAAVIKLDGFPHGVSLVSDPNDPTRLTNLIRVAVPETTTQALTFTYHLVAGGLIGPSAQVTVRAQENYNNPPRVFDHVASEARDGEVRVSVLKDAWDIDGRHEDLQIVSVSAGRFECKPDPVTGIDECVVIIPVTDQAQTVAYVVQDLDGAQSAAAIFVPGGLKEKPYLIKSSLINLAVNGTKTISLDDYIASPRGTSLYVTLATRAWTSPQAHLALTLNSDNEITLTAKNDYIGPASLTVEVRDSRDTTDTAAMIGVVTIPVQIGPVSPVLFCPNDTIEVVQGGAARTLPIAELCYAWMPTQELVSRLTFTGTWAVGKEHFMTVKSGRTLDVQAISTAKPGSHGWLQVGVEGYETTSEIQFRVVEAPKPVVWVASITDVQQGAPVTVPVTVTSPLSSPVPTVVEAKATKGDVAIEISGTDLLITPKPDFAGVLSFTVVASDLADSTRSDRWVTASFTVTVYGRPAAPSAPQPLDARSGTARMVFTPGADNGAPIKGYTIETEGGGTTNCGMNTTCEISGLTDGVSYRFRVKANNKAGDSEWSPWSVPVTPSAAPWQVRNVACGSPMKNQEVTITWEVPIGGYPATSYVVMGPTGSYSVSASDRSVTITGLENRTHQFRVVGENAAGLGQPSPYVTCWAAGPPTWPQGAAATVRTQNLGASRMVQVDWPAASPSGPGPVWYSVYRIKTTSPTPVLIGRTQDLSIGDSTVALNGETYTYRVEAENGAGYTATLNSGIWVSGESPGEWGANSVTLTATGATGAVRVNIVQFPDWRGADGEVTVFYRDIAIGTITPSSPTTYVTITDPSMNGLAFTVNLQACNESGCNTNTPFALADGPYGPLILDPIDIDLENRQPREICFTTGGSGNGRPAKIDLSALITGTTTVVPLDIYEVAIPAVGSHSVRVCATTEPATQITIYALMSSTNPNRNISSSHTVSSPNLDKLPRPDLKVSRDQNLFEGRAVCAEVSSATIGAGVDARLEITLDNVQVDTVTYSGTVQYTRKCWDAGGYSKAVQFSAQLMTLSSEWRDSDASYVEVSSFIPRPAAWSLGQASLNPSRDGPKLYFSVTSLPSGSNYVLFTIAGTEYRTNSNLLFPVETPFGSTYEATNVIACKDDGGVPICNNPYEEIHEGLSATPYGKLRVDYVSSSKDNGMACAVFSYDKGGASAALAMTNDLDTTPVTDTGSQVHQCVAIQPSVSRVVFVVTLTDTSGFERGVVQADYSVDFP